MNRIEFPKQIIECENFIGGGWQKAGGDLLDVHSPYTGAVVGRIRESDSDDVAAAAASAAEAQPGWEATPLKERTQIMFRFREYLLREIDTIANMVSLENGKTLSESRAGILKGIEVLEYALSLQNMDEGGRMEVSRGVFCEYRRKPLGVVAGITPFNFPAMVPMWMIPVAVTLGNTFIWKPSEKTPLTAKFLVEGLQEAGLPKGVLNVVQGSKEAVQAITSSPEIKAVGFVGSTKVAKIVYGLGCSNFKRVLALGGAKNHLILLPDADPDMSGAGISDSFTGCAGQRCMAASVLLAVGDVDHIIEKIVARAAGLQLGLGMGAVITREQVAFLKEAIGHAEQEGARIVLDGRHSKPVAEYEGGFWLGPTILDNVDPSSQAAREELFGPVLSIIRCKNLSEALAIENSNPYGNAASVFTSNGALAEKVVREASAAMVGINVGIPVPREPFSFGGMNDSKFGFGDITGKNCLNFWSVLRKVTTKWEMQSDHNWMS